MKEKDPPNGWLIFGYYLGIFSLLPAFGILLGLAGAILGFYGLIIRKRKQQVPGLWFGRTAIIVGLFGSGLQSFVLYYVVYSQ